MTAKEADGFIVNVDSPDGILCFWLRHPKFSFPPGNRLGNRQAFVQICPEGGQQFPSPEAGGQLQVEHRQNAMLLCRSEVVPQLFRWDGLHLLLFFRRQFTVCGGVVRNQPFHHRLVQALTEHRVAAADCPILRIGLSGFSPLDHYRLGQCIAQAVEPLRRRAVFAASGDLSHKLKGDGPYGFAPEGPEFDRQITVSIAAGDFLRFLIMDLALCERVAECGLRSFQIMTGALDGMAAKEKFLSYKGVTGAGYGVAAFAVTGPDENHRFGKQCEELEWVRLAEKRAAEDPWARLAQLSLETFVKTGERLERLPEGLPAEMTEEAAGAFVSLLACGQLRGCIGTTGPTTESVAIVQNAISACSRAPPFPAGDRAGVGQFGVQRGCAGPAVAHFLPG